MPQSATAASTPVAGRKTRAERAAENLAKMPRWKPGQSGNPLGRAVIKQRLHEQFRSFMASPSDFSEHGETNRVLLWRATLQTAIMGDSKAQDVLFAHDLGTEDGLLALAEHIRKVARDQAELSLAALGNRINSMTDEEKIAFFRGCTENPAAYLRAAEAEMQGHEPRAQLPPSTVEGESHTPEPQNVRGKDAQSDNPGTGGQAAPGPSAQSVCVPPGRVDDEEDGE